MKPLHQGALLWAAFLAATGDAEPHANEAYSSWSLRNPKLARDARIMGRKIWDTLP